MTLRKWLGLCLHNWVEVERGHLMNNGLRAGVYFIYQCEQCKKLKTVTS